MKKIIYYLILVVVIGTIIFLNFDNLVDFENKFVLSFKRTLIEEKRYLLILNGLKSTLIISFFAIFLGTILGIVIFLIKRIKIEVVRNITNFVVSLIQGTPITVLLLIFYYVIFENININPLIVAIIVFAIYFAAYVSQILVGAYNSINKSQINSAYSLGFTKIQTLRYILLPQILSYVIPVYKNECVSLIKLTSIAGYISIMELTKASDIIRNRTYEAFFPLILIAIMYFIICLLVSKMLNVFYRKVNHRAVKKIWALFWK